VRILITGGAGFVGSNLADFFLKNDSEVLCFDNLYRKGTEKNLEWLKENHKKNFSFIKGDIRSFDSLKEASRDVDVIFHTAAQTAVTTSLKDPRNDFEINALGTFNLLEAARQSNTDPIIIYTSTNKVYGDNVNAIPLKEKETRYEFDDEKFKLGIPEDFSTDADEHTPYGCSKYLGDVYMRDYYKIFGLKTITFRMSCIYGTRQFGNEDQGWVVHFIISSIFDKPLTIFGDGKQVRDILFISDLVNLFDIAIEKINKIKGQTFNIGGGSKNTCSLLELIQLIDELTDKKSKITHDDWRPSDQKVYISNISKVKKEINWEPEISVKEGVKKLIEWVEKNKNLFS